MSREWSERGEPGLIKWKVGDIIGSKKGEEMFGKLEGAGQLLYKEVVVERYEEDKDATM